MAGPCPKASAFCIVAALFFAQGEALAYERSVLWMEHKGRMEKVEYAYFVPKARPGEKERFPVLVYTGGVPFDGTNFPPGDAAEGMRPFFRDFAEQNRVALLGLGFTMVPEDWPTKESYQYAAAWSGEALIRILEEIAQTEPIHPKHLFLFGISAGAQFSARFALLYPNRTHAVAAHAAGGYDDPKTFVPANFLLTVGSEDSGAVNRLKMARDFAGACEAKGIAVRLEVIPGIGHQQTEVQDRMSMNFFIEVLSRVRLGSPDDFMVREEKSASHYSSDTVRSALVIPGTPRSRLLEIYSPAAVRTHRLEQDREWITFEDEDAGEKRLVTYQLKEEIVESHVLNDRNEIVSEYLSEFVSNGLIAMDALREAIRDVLTRLPDAAFWEATDRQYPLLFVEVYPGGKARLAASSPVAVPPGDPPAFRNGVWIVKLNADLESKPKAARAIIAHEIAHRVTRFRSEKDPEKLEKAVNRLIRRWGFGREFEDAIRQAR